MSADVAILSRHGEDVNVVDHLARGRITVIDFRADWCGACKLVTANMALVMRAHPGALAFREIDVTDGDDSPVVRHYLAGVPGLPYVMVFDRRGHLWRSLSGSDATHIDQSLAGLLAVGAAPAGAGPAPGRSRIR